MKIGMYDCAPLVEKRHMNKLVLLKEKMRSARKSGDALKRRLDEVQAFIKSCETCSQALTLDDSFFVDPDGIVKRRASMHDVEEFEKKIQSRIDSIDEELRNAHYEKRLQSPLDNDELTALLRKSVTLAGEAEDQATEEMRRVLNEAMETKKVPHWTLVSRCLWWERPGGLDAFKMAMAALFDQRTVVGALLASLRDKLESSPPKHRSTVANCMTYVTEIIRRRSPIDTCFPKKKSRAVRLLQLFLEANLVGPSLRRALSGKTVLADKHFENAVPAAFKAGPGAVGVPKEFLSSYDDDDDDDNSPSDSVSDSLSNGSTSAPPSARRRKKATPFALAALLLEKFGRSAAPAEAAATLLLAVRSIYLEAEIAAKRHLKDKKNAKEVPVFTADNLLPAMAWSCALAYVFGKQGFAVHRAIEYTSYCGGFEDPTPRERRGGLVRRPRSMYVSEVQYYLTSLQAAACSLERYGPSAAALTSSPADDNDDDSGRGDVVEARSVPETGPIDEPVTPTEEWKKLHRWIHSEMDRQKHLILLGDLGLVTLGGASI